MRQHPDKHNSPDRIPMPVHAAEYALNPPDFSVLHIQTAFDLRVDRIYHAGFHPCKLPAQRIHTGLRISPDDTTHQCPHPLHRGMDETFLHHSDIQDAEHTPPSSCETG